MRRQKNIKLTIEYDGGGYYGWQVQTTLPTIQGELEKAISRITNSSPVKIIGAGRTDRGVHAEGQVANFRTTAKMSPIEFQRALNSILPRDISIVDAEEVSDDFHSRFSATSRRYRYTVLNRKYPSAILRNYSYFFSKPIDLKSVDKIGKALIGARDFSSFQKSGSGRIDPVCEILDFEIRRLDDLIFLEVEADSFLRGMVRAIVGTILQIQDLENPVELMGKIVAAGTRSAAGTSIPAHGLSLISVNY